MTATAPFRSLLSNIVDNRGKTCPIAETGLPLIATNCVKNSTLYPVFEKVRYVDRHTYETWFRGHPLPGDLIFVCKGSPGQVCMTPDPVNFCIAQDMMAIRADPAKIYPPYLFAALRSDQVQNSITNMHVGTLIPHFKKGDFDKLDIPLPDSPTQHFTGDFYLAVTEKIELNRRMNETLEGMAQAIFQDWFVDFGPVRRKAAGAVDAQAIMGGLTTDPARAAQLAALFPAAFGEDDLPMGWTFAPLSDLLVLQRGFDLPKTTRTDGDFPVIAASGPSGTHNEFKVKGPGVCTGRSGVLGGVYYVDGDFWPLNTSLWVKDYPGSTPLYAFHLLRGIDLAGFNAGSAVPTLNRNHIHSLPTVKPPVAVIEAFDANVGSFYAKMAAGRAENETLAETRDYLLPRLMLGKVRVAPLVNEAGR